MNLPAYATAADWELAVNAIVRSIIKTALGLPDGTVRPANQNAPTGPLTGTDGTTPKQFATVLLSSIAPIGEDDRILESNTDPTLFTETVVGMREVVASVQFFRGNALHQANRLKALCRLDSILQLFNEAGLGFISTGL